MEENKEPQMSPEELQLLIDQNEYLKLWVKCLNGIPMNDPKNYDYLKLYNNIALKKVIKIDEPTPEAVEFYFQLFSCGLDNFGAECISKMAETDPGALAYGISSLLYILSENSKNFDKSQDIIE